MPIRRLFLLLAVLLLLGVFLWAAVNINREVEISVFTTSLEGRTKDQIDNLQLASNKIDGVVINPGEIFSFNDIVGPRLARWGYKGAPTIYQRRLINTPGGGLCQMVSTLYNAALLAGMDIIERTPHLWVVDSVGPGRDATILYDKIDLKFRNNYDFPVKVRSSIESKQLVIRFLAPQKLKDKIYIKVDVLQVYPPPRYPSYNEVTGKGKYGYKVRVYRIFKRNGKIVKKELISVDRYEPVPGKV